MTASTANSVRFWARTWPAISVLSSTVFDPMMRIASAATSTRCASRAAFTLRVFGIAEIAAELTGALKGPAGIARNVASLSQSL